MSKESVNRVNSNHSDTAGRALWVMRSASQLVHQLVEVLKMKGPSAGAPVLLFEVSPLRPSFFSFPVGFAQLALQNFTNRTAWQFRSALQCT